MRILSNADIEQVLTPGECLSALESAYVELAQGKGANRPRNHTYFPVEDPRHPGFRFRFKSIKKSSSKESGRKSKTDATTTIYIIVIFPRRRKKRRRREFKYREKTG